MEQRVSLITLGVADVGRARVFYERLGWQTAVEPASDVSLLPGGRHRRSRCGAGPRSRRTASSVTTAAAGAASRSRTTSAPGTRSTPSSHEAEAAGATIARPGAETFWGGYSGVFVDPDGHRWEVAHNPYWTLRDDGSVLLPD